MAQALSGDEDAISQLRALERDGLFLTATDATRSVYRYHSLFGALLRARLRERQATQARELARRAALWFAQHDMAVEAERHAAQARDWLLLGQFACDRWLDTAYSDTQRLAEIRPRCLGQASRIPGVTPAAISILMVYSRPVARA